MTTEELKKIRPKWIVPPTPCQLREVIVWGSPVGVWQRSFIMNLGSSCPASLSQKTQPEEIPDAVPRTCLFLITTGEKSG